MTLKIKDKKLFERKCILYFLFNVKNLNNNGLFVNKESGSGIFLYLDPDMCDPKRQDPTVSDLRIPIFAKLTSKSHNSTGFNPHIIGFHVFLFLYGGNF